MFVYNDARHDARVWREAATLRDSGRTLTVVALQSGGLSDREERAEGTLLRLAGPRRGVRPGDPSPFRGLRGGLIGHLSWLRGYARELLGWRDAAVRAALDVVPEGARVVWHGHDLTGLMPAARCASVRPGALVYDSHELFLEAGSAARLPTPARRLLAWYERRLARLADAVVTVNESIADELAVRYRIDRPTVVMNCPPLGPEPMDRLASPLRTTLGLGERLVVLHHGQLAEGRGLREAIAALALLPQTVALVALGNGELVPDLQAMAERPGLRGRLFVHPAVTLDELPSWIAGADAGLITFLPVDRNNVYGTPNKLFECLAAGVPVIVSDFPEMRRIVNEFDVGMVADPADPASVTTAVRRLLLDVSVRDRAARRAACRAAAHSRFSWEHESRSLLGVYDRVASKRSSLRSRDQGSGCPTTER